MSDDFWTRQLAKYDAAVLLLEGVERLGKTMPYTSANGHMFSQLNKTGELGIRLPEDLRSSFLVEHDTELFTAYNTVMKEYVLVPQTMLDDRNIVQHYLDISHRYVLSLKAK